MPNELVFQMGNIKDYMDSVGVDNQDVNEKLDEYGHLLQGTTLRFLRDPVTLS